MPTKARHPGGQPGASIATNQTPSIAQPQRTSKLTLVPPAPRLLVTLSEADLDERDQRLLDAIGELVAARSPKVLLDTSGVSQLLGVTGQTVKKLRDEGMPHVRVGECYRFDADAVLEWLRQRAEGQR